MSRPDPLALTRNSGAAPLFAALGDATRLGLLVALCSGGPLSATRLSSGFAVSRQAILKHLDVLAEAGLVRSRRSGAGAGATGAAATPSRSRIRAAAAWAASLWP